MEHKPPNLRNPLTFFNPQYSLASKGLASPNVKDEQAHSCQDVPKVTLSGANIVIQV